MQATLSRRSLLVGGLAAAGGLAASAAHSAEDKSEKSASKSSGGLTIESLGDMLKALGLSPTKVESRFDFEFAAKHTEEWTLSMSAVLSTDEKSIWIIAWLDELPQSAADVPRTALLRLLADNDKLGKGQFFAYVPSVRRFVLQRTIENQHVTSAVFKSALKDLGATVVDTYGHWKVDFWKQLGRPAAASKQPKDESGDDLKADKSAKVRTGGAPNARTAVKDAAGADAKPVRK
jgi:hypothetical protein